MGEGWTASMSVHLGFLGSPGISQVGTFEGRDKDDNIYTRPLKS